MAPSIFINYRSIDAAALACLMQRELAAVFGEDAVFRDDSSIPPGKDFRKYLWRRLYGCDVLLALFGPHWWDPVEPGGDAPVMNPDDFVRMEIEAALEWEIEVVPVLTEGVGRLSGRPFPPSLESLPFRQYRTIRDRSATTDIQTLARDLGKLIGTSSDSSPTHRASGISVDDNRGIIAQGNGNTNFQFPQPSDE